MQVSGPSRPGRDPTTSTTGRVTTKEIAARVPVRVPCARCKGRGKRRWMKGHKTDCHCVMCRPCETCDGTGRVNKEA